MGLLDELRGAGAALLGELQKEIFVQPDDQEEALDDQEEALEDAQEETLSDEPITTASATVSATVSAQTTASAPAQAPAPEPAPAPQSAPTSGLYDPQLEKLIDLALVDGQLTDKERQVLCRKAQSMGIDLDEFEMVLDARVYHRSQQAPAQPAQAPVQPKKVKEVRKCPACGALVESFTTRCAECGYEFRNVEANGGIRRLFEMLNEVETTSREDATGLLEGLGRTYADLFAQSFGGTKATRRKKAIIQNFPIPNTKDDILEFLALALPLAKKPGVFDQDMEKREMYPTWKAKCEQVIMKARFSMKNDPKTLAEINEYGKQIGIK
jgi:hypothetical protein